MPAVSFDNQRPGCYLGESASLNIINEEIILASGSGVVKPGTVLGKVTTTGKYEPLDTAATDGTQTAAAILFAGADATSADKKAVATVNGPATINGNMLVFPAGISAPNRLAAIAALRAKGLKVLPQHAA